MADTKNCHLAPLAQSLASVRDTLTSLNPAGTAVVDPQGLRTVKAAADVHIPVLRAADPRDCRECSRYAQELQHISDGRHPTHPFVQEVNATLVGIERRMGSATVDHCLTRPR